MHHDSFHSLLRVHQKVYRELKDSDGRPNQEVANEVWCVKIFLCTYECTSLYATYVRICNYIPEAWTTYI